MGGSHSKSRSRSKSDDLSRSLKDQLVQRSSSKSIHDKYRVADAQIMASGTSTHICHATSKTYRKTAQHFSSGAGSVAIKIYDGTSANRPNLAKEAMLLQQCDHPNIVKLYEVIGGKTHSSSSSSSKHEHPPSLVLELCTGGTVLDRLPSFASNECVIAQIMRQVTSAVAYLHAKAIVHRDVHGHNVLFESKKEENDESNNNSSSNFSEKDHTENNVVKLIDFGSADQLETIEIPGHGKAFKMLREIAGTLESMAPEVLQPDVKYGPSCDVWSLGILAYTLLNKGQSPFAGLKGDELKREILTGTIDYENWKHSTFSKKFVQNCLERDASKRWTAASALQSNWIKLKGSGSTSPTNKSKDSEEGGSTPTKHATAATLPTDIIMSMELYRCANPIKRIALNALARKQQASSRLRNMFNQLDVNNSSTLTKEEFMFGFKDSGNSEEGLHDLFRIMDVNGNGEIMYTEFLAATLEADGELSDSQLREAFDHMDVDRSGSISKSDLKELLGQSEHAKSLIAECLEYMDSGMHGSYSVSNANIPAPPTSPTKKKTKISSKIKKSVRKSKKSNMDYEEFEQMFDHGFDSGLIHRGMPAITETSLNAEQLNRMKSDGLIIAESFSFGSA